MKFAAVFLLAFIAAAVAAPTSISDNNVGNIITVGVSGSLKLSNEIDQTLVSVIVAALNRQGIVVAPSDEQVAINEVPKLPENFNISPEMITPEMIEQFKALLA